MPITRCQVCGIEICYPRGESAQHHCRKVIPLAPQPLSDISDEAESEKAPDGFEEGDGVDPEGQPKHRRKRFSDPEMQEGGK